MSDYTELQKAAAYAAQDTIKFADEDEEMRALQQFHQEVTPETVLALIAENERLRTDLDGEISQARDFNIEHEELKSERDHLKAENESLRRQAETAQRGAGQLKAENEALRDGANFRAIQSLRQDCEELREQNDKLTRRNGMLEQNVQAMTETHVLYTWLRKKCDQSSNDFVAVQMNIGHDWVPVHDLDRDLRSMIEREEP